MTDFREWAVLFTFVRRLSVFAFLTVALTSCAALHDPDEFWRQLTFWNNKPYPDMALGAVARGDMAAAEEYVEKGLFRNPKDPRALYAAGVVYQNTGRPRKARQAYQEMLALDVDGQIMEPGENQLAHKQLSERAEKNLRILDSGTEGELVGTTLVPLGDATPQLSGEPITRHDLGQQKLGKNGVNSGTDAVAKRFVIFRRLLDEGLVTDDEYRTRRAKNIGALLPLTSDPPGVGLERPVPKSEEISERLKALRASFEMRAISAAEHEAERLMILDSLLPAGPPSAIKLPPPSDLIEAGAMSGRLVRLLADGLITAQEKVREQAAIEAAMRGPAMMEGPSGGETRLVIPPSSRASVGNNKPKARVPAKTARGKSGSKGNGEKAAGNGEKAAHLASYKTKAAAEDGWREIKAAFPGILGDFSPAFTSTNLGAKGTFIRLTVGPLSNSSATALCKRLAAKHQFCTTIPF